MIENRSDFRFGFRTPNSSKIAILKESGSANRNCSTTGSEIENSNRIDSATDSGYLSEYSSAIGFDYRTEIQTGSATGFQIETVIGNANLTGFGCCCLNLIETRSATGSATSSPIEIALGSVN